MVSCTVLLMVCWDLLIETMFVISDPPFQFRAYSIWNDHYPRYCVLSRVYLNAFDDDYQMSILMNVMSLTLYVIQFQLILDQYNII